MDSKIDVADGHDHTRVFGADGAIRGDLFLYHISTAVNEGHEMF